MLVGGWEVLGVALGAAVLVLGAALALLALAARAARARAARQE